jgi:hypothetical protein
MADDFGYYLLSGKLGTISGSVNIRREEKQFNNAD